MGVEHLIEFFMLLELSGCIASIASTVSLLPQVIKTYRSKSAADLSWFTIGLLFTAAVFWLIYGIILQSHALIISNVFQFIFSSTLLGLKCKDVCCK